MIQDLRRAGQYREGISKGGTESISRELTGIDNKVKELTALQ
jgi:hypothetical protein